jgi:hypothetical protein
MNDKFNTLNFDMNSCNLYQFEDVDYLKEKRKDAEDLLKKKGKSSIKLQFDEIRRTSSKQYVPGSKLL